jgi:hypothetical protein
MQAVAPFPRCVRGPVRPGAVLREDTVNTPPTDRRDQGGSDPAAITMANAQVRDVAEWNVINRSPPDVDVYHCPMTSTAPAVRWLSEPEDHDYPAAGGYLELLADPDTVTALVGQLRAAPMVHKKAEDILRAAQLPLLPPDNPHVRADLAKILTGKPLFPILLVQGDLSTGTPMQIADGYHRVCACDHTDENIPIPTRLAAMRDGKPVGTKAAKKPAKSGGSSKSKK